MERGYSRILLLILAVVMVLIMGCAAKDTAAQPAIAEELLTEGILCYTLDQNGEVIRGFWNEEEDVWYLFVPSVLEIPDLTVYCTSAMAEVSSGRLRQDGRAITGAFSGSGDRVELRSQTGQIHTVAVMRSGLPSVQIYLSNTTLETIHQDKTVKHSGNTVIIADSLGTNDLIAKKSVQINARGNSTWTLTEKKAYQIKFSAKTSVLGMAPAKKWILLSNAFDDSMMRNQLVYTMAEKLDMDFVPSFEYVDLWIDGEYLGTYLLGEKVEIGNARLNLDHVSGALFEHDEGFYEEEAYWFFSSSLSRHFTLKDIQYEQERNITAAMEDFEAAIDELTSYLYTTPASKVSMDDLSAMIDVDSFAKYYLINEYVMNTESFVSSFYWYKDGPDDVIHLGPVWDFDTCMGNDGAAYTASYGKNHMLFHYLLAIPEFYSRTEELYARYRSEFAAMTADIPEIREEIRESVEMNDLRWDVLGEENPKAQGQTFRGTFDEATAAVMQWLQGRQENFQVPATVAITSKISQDYSTMELYLDDGGRYSQVSFAVWAAQDPRGVTLWYPAERTDGIWHAVVDLSHYSAAGIYYMNAYADEMLSVAAAGCNYVPEAVECAYPLTARLSDDGSIMTITLQENAPRGSVTFGVWSEAGGTDDAHWFEAERNGDGVWQYSVDMTMYPDPGRYYIQACDNGSGDSVLLNVTTVTVEADGN